MRPVYATLAIAAAAALVLALTPPADARGGGGGHGGGAATFGSVRATFGSTGYPHGFSSRGRRMGWNGASTPRGWSHGHKTGWHRGTMPPGLARHMTPRTSSRTRSR